MPRRKRSRSRFGRANGRSLGRARRRRRCKYGVNKRTGACLKHPRRRRRRRR